ncbi:MAG: SRPBCC family protein [Pseudomonadota bacterium]
MQDNRVVDVTIHKAGLSLGLERTIQAPRAVVWRCWTDPDLFKRWYCPAPWTVPEADLDVRPGGRFNCVMAGPDGERFETVGCYLDVVDGARLVFTDAYSEGFMPRPESFMTGVVELADAGANDTRMIWTARHACQDDVAKHLEMGFEQGWPAAAEQLNALAAEIAP